MRLLMVAPRVVSFRFFLKEVGEAIVAAGGEAHCACAMDEMWTGADDSTDGRVRLHDLPFPRGMNPLQHLAAARQLRQLVADLQPDLVHAHIGAAVFTTALARRPSWPPTIGTFQGLNFPLSDGLKARVLRKAETWASERLDAVWVVTEDDRQALASAAPRADVRIQESCGVGCDTDRFRPDSVTTEARSGIQAELGLSPEHHVFTFIGRYAVFKGFDLVVRAFLALAREDDQARLLLVGARDPLHPTGLSREEEEARQCSDRIIDAGWQTDVRPYLAVSDVVVFPSQREGKPVCLMEALAMGVPVITRDARGCRDVVRDGQDGLVLRDCNEQSLAEAMSKLTTDRDLYERMRDEALAGRDRFSRVNFVRELQRDYQRILGAPDA